MVTLAHDLAPVLTALREKQAALSEAIEVLERLVAKTPSTRPRPVTSTRRRRAVEPVEAVEAIEPTEPPVPERRVTEVAEARRQRVLRAIAQMGEYGMTIAALKAKLHDSADAKAIANDLQALKTLGAIRRQGNTWVAIHEGLRSVG